MYLAEIRGKLSRENENKEDILTSNVFSFFKYTNRRIFLYELLEYLGLNITPNEAEQAEFIFWPTYEDRTEPDLVIIVGDYYLLIEAKYTSGFGEETEEIKHQLVREIEGGKSEASNLDKKFKIIAVTAHYYFHNDIVKDVPLEYRGDLLWINWQKIGYLIYQTLETYPSISKETSLFGEDLYLLLVKKNLRNFEGVDAINDLNNIKLYDGELFFEAKTASFRGDFFGFTEVLTSDNKIIDVPSRVFFEANTASFRGDFFGFIEIPIDARKFTIVPPKIFFEANTARIMRDFFGFTEDLIGDRKLNAAPSLVFFKKDGKYFKTINALQTQIKPRTEEVFYRKERLNE